MHASTFFRIAKAMALATLLLHQQALALVSIDDGKNRLFVNASVSYSWDSNIYSIRDGASDGIYSASLGVEFARRAGFIAVNGSAYIDASSFITNKGENFQNPRFGLEFTKPSGRTSASLLMNAAKQSRSDAAANMRNESWVYEADLNLKYPVIERYSLAGGLGYSRRDFEDNAMLVDLDTYAANLDLFYVYNTERDLIAGYRLRYSETSLNRSFYDHAFTVGLSGKVLPKLSGTVRFGYQFRDAYGGGDESYDSITASGGVNWSLSKKTRITLNLAKDFMTTSTNASVDSTSLVLNAIHAVNSKLSTRLGGSCGVNRFLGISGGGRRDEFAGVDAGVDYAVFRERLTLSASYSYMHNWSNFHFSNFKRSSFTISASSRF